MEKVPEIDGARRRIQEINGGRWLFRLEQKIQLTFSYDVKKNAS